ncbi:MAG: VanZ family protein [Bacilli bacterium]|nr:VanZ family protein [Bacilli bacterium]
MKKYIYAILTIIWLIVIFLFSSQNGTLSKKLTTDSIGKVINTNVSTDKEGTQEYKVEQKKENAKESLIDSLIKPVRKSAHFFEYMILAILVFLFLRQCNKPMHFILLGTFLFCTFYASTDEFHQLFVQGRTARFFDIFVDSLGATFGLLIIYFIVGKKVTHEKRK